MTVNDQPLQADVPKKFFKTLGRSSVRAGSKLSTNERKNPGRALEIGAKVGTAALSKNPKAVLSTVTELKHFIILIKDIISDKLNRYKYKY